MSECGCGCYQPLPYVRMNTYLYNDLEGDYYLFKAKGMEEAVHKLYNKYKWPKYAHLFDDSSDEMSDDAKHCKLHS